MRSGGAAASRMRSDSRSAAAIVGRFVFARGTSGNTEASATQRPSTPSTRPVRVDDSARVVGRAHAAGAADVARVADRLHQPRVDRRVVGERLEAAAGQVDRDVLEGRVERAAAQQVERALDAVAHAHAGRRASLSRS